MGEERLVLERELLERMRTMKVRDLVGDSLGQKARPAALVDRGIGAERAAKAAALR